MFEHFDTNEYNPMTDDYVTEIASELSEPDRRKLHNMLQQLGICGWYNWLDNHLADAERYLCETTWPDKKPRRRSQLKEINDEQRLLSAYGAIWLSQMAMQFRPYLYGFSEELNIAYPAARSEIGALAMRAHLLQVDHWPFYEPDDLEDPFL